MPRRWFGWLNTGRGSRGKLVNNHFGFFKSKFAWRLRLLLICLQGQWFCFLYSPGLLWCDLNFQRAFPFGFSFNLVLCIRCILCFRRQLMGNWMWITFFCCFSWVSNPYKKDLNGHKIHTSLNVSSEGLDLWYVYITNIHIYMHTHTHTYIYAFLWHIYTHIYIYFFFFALPIRKSS